MSEVTGHPAVAAARVVDDVVYVVPDERQAPLLRRAWSMSLPDGVSWHEPADDLLVAGINRTETDFLYRELWAGNAYLRRGIVLPDRAVVVDVGANIGMFGLYAAAMSPGARIIAVEPMAESARAAAVNGQLHEVNLTVITEAVGRAPGVTDFTFYPRNTVMSGQYADQDQDWEVLRGYLSTNAGAAGLDLGPMVADRLAAEIRRVPVTTVPEVVARTGLRSIDLLKVDMEKAEWDVLAGMDATTWAMIEQVAIEVHDLDGRLDLVLNLLRQKGFTVAHERDPRLAGTPCHTVYGRKPTARIVPAVPAVPPSRATGRALAAELQSFLAGSQRVVVVPSLDLVPTAERAIESQAASVLAEIWADLFGTAAVRPDADFFELGGNSLTAVRLISRLESRLGEGVLAPDTVFTTSRFGDLIAAVEAGAP